MIIKRLKAFLLDYLLMLAYIVFLFGLTMLVSKIFELDLGAISPGQGQLIGFFTLTLPVILYFTFSENSRYAGSFGKRRMHLRVVNKNSGSARFRQLLLRNCLKFLPWELAHFFVFQLFYYLRNDAEPPQWVSFGLIASQALALLYLLSILLSKSKRAVYEVLSNTKVVQAASG